MEKKLKIVFTTLILFVIVVSVILDNFGFFFSKTIETYINHLHLHLFTFAVIQLVLCAIIGLINSEDLSDTEDRSYFNWPIIITLLIQIIVIFQITGNRYDYLIRQHGAWEVHFRIYLPLLLFIISRPLYRLNRIDKNLKKLLEKKEEKDTE